MLLDAAFLRASYMETHVLVVALIAGTRNTHSSPHFPKSRSRPLGSVSSLPDLSLPNNKDTHLRTRVPRYVSMNRIKSG